MAKQIKMRASSTCSSSILSAGTNSNYEGLAGLASFFCDLPDEHFANGAHSSAESSPRKPFEDISDNNRDFVRSESGMTTNEEKEPYSSPQYGYLGTRYQFLYIRFHTYIFF